MSKRTLHEQQPTATSRSSSSSSSSNGSSNQHDIETAASHIADAAAAQTSPSVDPLSEHEPARKRTRIASSRPRPFDRLAAVECQLILQWLDNTSRLVASRCSRALRTEASHPFSWRYAEPVTLLSSEVKKRLPRVESSLLRLAPIHLHFDCNLQSAAEVVAIPRLRGIVGDQVTAFHSQPALSWRELLAHPSMQQLRTLHCRFDDHMGRHMPLIVQLPHLTSLAFYAGRHAAADEVSLLSNAPASLTSVRCYTPPRLDHARLAPLQALTCMPQLRRLWLICPPFTAWSESEPHCTSLCAFFTSPNLAHLTHLTLQGVDMTASDFGAPLTTPSDCAAAFGALRDLTHLRLIDVGGVDQLLPSVARARSLQRLRVCVRHATAAEGAHTQPSVDVLRTLVESMPLLHVRLTPLCFVPTAHTWPAHAACEGLPRVTLVLEVSFRDILQDEY